MDCSPPGSSVHGILQARVGCHALLQGVFPIQGWNPHLLFYLHWQVSSFLKYSLILAKYSSNTQTHVQHRDMFCTQLLWSRPTLCNPMKHSPPGSARGFSNPGIQPVSPVSPTLQADSLLLIHQGSPRHTFKQKRTVSQSLVILYNFFDLSPCHLSMLLLLLSRFSRVRPCATP